MQTSLFVREPLRQFEWIGDPLERLDTWRFGVSRPVLAPQRQETHIPGYWESIARPIGRTRLKRAYIDKHWQYKMAQCDD
jgi:hypothetical protein